MTTKRWLKTNIVYGLVVIVPLAVLALLLAKVVEILQNISVALELDSTLGAGVAIITAFLFLLLACIGIGAIVRTNIGSWSFARLEAAVFKRVPGYELVANILKGFVGEEDAYPAVMVQLHGPGSAVLGLVMEEHQSGMLTVFVPSAPAATVGAVHVIERERVTFLQASTIDVVNCISQWGIGSHKVVGGGSRL